MRALDSGIYGIFAMLLLLPAADVEGSGGLLVFKSSPNDPDDLARVIPFSEAEQGPRATEYTPEGSKERFQVFNDQLIALIPFPNLDRATIRDASDIEELRQLSEEMKRTANRFPAALDPLTAPYREVQAALENFDKSMILVAGGWEERRSSATAKMATGEKLRIILPDGSVKSYEGVEVMRVEGANFVFKHSGGVAQAALDALSAEDRERIGLPSQLLKEKPASPTEASPFVGIWEQTTENFHEPFAQYRAYEFQPDGTVTCYARRNSEEPWVEWFTSTWEEVDRQFTDTRQPYRGVEITGSIGDWSYQQLGIVYVLAEDGLVAASNVDAMRESVAAGTSFSDVLLSETGKRIKSSDSSPRNPWSKFTKTENFTP